MTSSYKVTTVLDEHTIEGVHGINHDNHLIFFNEQGKVFAGFASDVWERFEKITDDTHTEVQPATNTQDAPVAGEFNIGDRVRVEPGTVSFFDGVIPAPYTGVIESFNKFNDEHINVDFEGRSGSVMWKADLIKVEVEDAPVQPERLAAWERDLLGQWFESGEAVTQDDLDYFDAGTVVVDGDGDQWVKNNDGTWSIGWSQGDYVNWDSEKMFDPDETVTPFEFANYPEPVEAEAQPTNEPDIKVGDRVRIVDSYYTGHPSRMKGGTGTVERIYDGSVGC